MGQEQPPALVQPVLRIGRGKEAVELAALMVLLRAGEQVFQERLGGRRRREQDAAGDVGSQADPRAQGSAEVLRQYHRTHATGFPVEPLIAVLKEINLRIGDPNYHLGSTFFLHADLRARIEDIWTMEIVPYLEEYYVDQPARAQLWAWDGELVRGVRERRDGD